MPKLTARQVVTIAKPGLHGDGEGLYLLVKPTGARSWVLRTVVQGKRRDLGLGSVLNVTLAEARDKARELRKVAREGGDPTASTQVAHITFEEAARSYHATLAETFRSDRHARAWIASMEQRVFPEFGGQPIDAVATANLLRVLRPIWARTPNTAKRIKQRMVAVFDWAKASGHYSRENPGVGLSKVLPTVDWEVNHMPALPWPDLPAFMAALAVRQGISARALEFLILTAARSGEVRGARWSEVQGNLWTIPAARMKANRTHVVPLTADALAVLDKVRGLSENLIFPSSVQRTLDAVPMSDMVFKALMDRMKVRGITTHGFRSTFRDWCGDEACAPRELAEAALAHVVGSQVERAYARSNLLERRRKLMEHWSDFACGREGGRPQPA